MSLLTRIVTFLVVFLIPSALAWIVGFGFERGPYTCLLMVFSLLVALICALADCVWDEWPYDPHL